MTITSTDTPNRLNTTLWGRMRWSRALGRAPRSQGRAGRTRTAALDVITAIGFAAYLSLPLRLAADTIYVSNYGDSTVTRVTADGQKQTYASGLRLPYGLAFDARGNLLCASGQTNQIYSIATNGIVRAYGSGLKYANLAGLAFDASGNLYAADQNNNVGVRVLAGGEKKNFGTGADVPR